MAETDAVQAIRDAIAHLEDASAPVEEQIRTIREDADARIAALEAEIAEHREELHRWRSALARAEGSAPPAASSSSRRRSTATLEATDDDLVRVLREHDGSLSASQLREALGIDADVPAAKLTRFLGDAVERGVAVRTGERRATRYSAA